MKNELAVVCSFGASFIPLAILCHGCILANKKTFFHVADRLQKTADE